MPRVAQPLEIPEAERDGLRRLTREELLEAVGRVGVLALRRREWELVRKTPKRWKFLRDLYASITPGILSGERCDRHIIEWDFTPIELDMWCSIRELGLPFWPQYPVGRFFVDFGDPVFRIALECDGHQYHSDQLDAARDAELKGLGWKVYRFPGWQCVKGEDDPESSHQRLVQACWSYYPQIRDLPRDLPFDDEE